MNNENRTTQSPHQISGIAEFLFMVRWLRSIDSLIISRLRSAVRLLFSSIVVSLFRGLVFVFTILWSRPRSCRKHVFDHLCPVHGCKGREVYNINQIILQNICFSARNLTFRRRKLEKKILRRGVMDMMKATSLGCCIAFLSMIQKKENIYPLKFFREKTYMPTLETRISLCHNSFLACRFWCRHAFLV